jgi:sialic acid synthase SpsE
MKFIAEIGSNYVTKKDGRSLNRALALIEEAAAAGATHAKFQLFTGDTLHSNPNVQKSLNAVALPREWLPQLAAECRTNHIEFLCTPFDVDAVDVLDEFVNEWKVASWDITYIPLLNKLAQNGKPVILSTGAATIEEIETAITLLRPGDDFPDDITILHCHPGYPIQLKEFNMRRMLEIVSEFTYDMDGTGFIDYGLSSHFVDPVLNASSVLLGATTIEAHFDLFDKLGNEAEHSLSPSQFREMVTWAERFRLARGGYQDGFTTGEQFCRDNYRRSDEDWLRPVVR